MRTTSSVNKMNREAAFIDAAANGLVDVVMDMLQKKLCDVDCQDEEGWTAMMKAVSNGHKDVADVLYAHECNLDLQNNEGDTALMWAASNGHNKDAVNLLLTNYKCNVDVQSDNEGWTALICAAGHGYKDIVDILLAHNLSLIHISEPTRPY